MPLRGSRGKSRRFVIKAWIAGDPQHPGWSARRRERPVGSGPEWWVEYGVYCPLKSVERLFSMTYRAQVAERLRRALIEPVQPYPAVMVMEAAVPDRLPSGRQNREPVTDYTSKTGTGPARPRCHAPTGVCGRSLLCLPWFLPYSSERAASTWRSFPLRAIRSRGRVRARASTCTVTYTRRSRRPGTGTLTCGAVRLPAGEAERHPTAGPSAAGMKNRPRPQHPDAAERRRTRHAVTATVRTRR